MAVFSKNTLAQVSGFNNPIISGELVYSQRTFWNLTMATCKTAIDLTGVAIDAQIIRRKVSNVSDSRSHLSFDIEDYPGNPTPVTLSIVNRDDATGKFTLVIDDTAWGLVASDADLDISAANPVAFSGRIKLSFPAVGSTPAQDSVIFLLFLVRSDALVN